MFKLYGTERPIFTFDDYAALIAECGRIGARKVLEFGPGVSTLALIEAGCERVVTCEYQEQWLDRAVETFKAYPQVTVHRFVNRVDVEVAGLARTQFDLAFVDSPIGMEARSAQRLEGQEECSRLNTVSFALACSPVVLLHDAKREGEGHALARIAAAGHAVEMIDTVKGIARIARKPAEAVPLS